MCVYVVVFVDELEYDEMLSENENGCVRNDDVGVDERVRGICGK